MRLTFSVSQFVDYLREHLRTTVGEVTIQGEMTGYRERGDNLVFFDLKDEESVITCFLLKYELSQPLEDGMEVKITGVPSLFKKSGKFHVKVLTVTLVGEGALRRALLKLKEKLDKEGLLDPARKRALPRFPERIGLVTSPDAAAYTDVLRALKRRWRAHTVVVAPVRVQGEGAARDIIRGLNAANSHGRVDVVIVTRGGGSLEDLAAFNDEAVARAIVASRAPVVCGVGHERDITIAELVADLRASTPTAAAELVAPARAEVALDLRDLARRLEASLLDVVADENERVTTLLDRLQRAFRAPVQAADALIGRLRVAFASFAGRPSLGSERVAALEHRLLTVAPGWLQRTRLALDGLLRTLTTLNPRAVFARGYSVTFDVQGQVIHDAEALWKGQQVRTQVEHGEFTSEVL